MHPLIRVLISVCVLALLIVLGISAFGGPGPQSVREGVPKAADYLAFYAGGTILSEGEGGRLYEPRLYRETLERHADSDVKYFAVYPPPLYQAMTAVQPLGYQRAAQLHLAVQALLMALGAWLLVTALPELGTWGRPAFWLLAASPFAIMNILTGQGAGFWLTIVGAGLLLVRRGRPLLGGIVLGLLCAKPSLALAVAGFLLLSGQLRSFVGFGLGGALLVALSLPLHGVAPWLAWVDWLRSPAATGFWPMPERQMTWRTLAGWPLRGTRSHDLVLPAVALIGLPLAAALGRRVWRLPPADPRWPLRAGLVLSVLLLCLPHMIEYDYGMHGLALLGVALAVRERPTRAGIAMLVLAWIAPLLHPVSLALHVALGPLILTAALSWAVLQSRASSAPNSASTSAASL